MANNSINEALQSLRETLARDDDVSITEIDKAIAKVVEFKDYSCVGLLLSLLNDDFVYDEAMFSLIHAAEAVDDRIYTRELLRVLPQILLSAPSWTSVVTMRVLNNQATKAELITALRSASEDGKKAMTQLCKKINAVSPEFMNKTISVLVAANT